MFRPRYGGEVSFFFDKGRLKFGEVCVRFDEVCVRFGEVRVCFGEVRVCFCEVRVRLGEIAQKYFTLESPGLSRVSALYYVEGEETTDLPSRCIVCQESD